MLRLRHNIGSSPQQLAYAPNTGATDGLVKFAVDKDIMLGEIDSRCSGLDT